MIKIDFIEARGFESAVMGTRNSYNSWEKCDSYTDLNGRFILGPQDYILLCKLIKAGPSHCKFRRTIQVWMGITAPLYWWKEFDTYKVGTTANSCSTMHTISDKPITINDFSHDKILEGSGSEIVLSDYVAYLDVLRERYLETKNKEYWYQLIQLLPSSYNQKRTVNLNYEVLANIYQQRKDHKLDEWHDFCDYIEEFAPYSELITGKVD